jgi:hypothetical protein
VERGDGEDGAIHPVKRRTARDFALIGTVFAELGRGRITTTFIRDKGYVTDGLTDGRHIWINEDHQTADSVIHECVHRAFPKWSESYVRRTTTYIRRRMSDDEIMTLVAIYRKRATRRKKPLVIDE